jgi:hypothetical protein
MVSNGGIICCENPRAVRQLSSPANGASYALNQQVVVNFNCFDSGSGVASCSGSGGNNMQVITMSALGSGSFTVTGLDRAGNTTVVTLTYTVHP